MALKDGPQWGPKDLKERPFQTVKVNSDDFSELSIPSSAKVKYLVQDGSQELCIEGFRITIN